MIRFFAWALAVGVILCGCKSEDSPRVVETKAFYHGDPDDKPTRATLRRGQEVCANYKNGPVVITLGFTVETSGTVSHIHTISEDPHIPDCAEEVMYAFRRWKFKPHLDENGKSVPYDRTITLNLSQPDYEQPS